MVRSLFSWVAVGSMLLGAAPAGAFVFGFSEPSGSNVIVTDQGTMPVLVSGWYRQTGSDAGNHSSSNPNYIVGRNEIERAVFNNFFVFDVSGLDGPISTATVQLATFGVNLSFDGSDPVTYSLFDVSTAMNELVADQSNRGDIWSDLGSGSLYGSRSYTGADENTTQSIVLSAAAIAAINDAWQAEARNFAMGGTLSAAVTTPEPATAAVLGLGLAGLLAMRRRRG